MRRPFPLDSSVVAFLTLVAFAVRAFSLDAQSLWRDEVDALRFASVPWTELLASFTRVGWNGSLYHLLLRGWVALAGTSEYAMRFLSLLLGVLCLPLVYGLGCRLLDRRTGLVAALLVALSPYLAWYGQEVKMYTLVPFLALLAIYGLRRAVESAGGWRWWGVQIAATSLAFHAHILAALLIPVQALLVLVWWPRSRRHLVGALLSLACLILPYLPLAAWQIPLVFVPRDTGFGAATLGRMVQILLNGWGLGILGTSGLAEPWDIVATCGVGLMVFMAGWGLVHPSFGLLVATHPIPPHPQEAGWAPLPAADQERGMWEGRLALLAWLLIPLLAVWLVSLWQPIFTDRYLIWIAPAFTLLVAAGLTSFLHVGREGRFATMLLSALLLSFAGLGLWRQASTPIKSDFRSAVAYMVERQAADEPLALPSSPGDPGTRDFQVYLPFVAVDRNFQGLIIFQIPYARYTFDYYFPYDGYAWADGLYTNHRMPDGSYMIDDMSVAWQMEKVAEGYDVIWLVASEEDLWDDRRLVRNWLDTHMDLTDAAEFVHVRVYRYSRRSTVQ